MTAIKREEIIGDCRLILGDNMPIMADMADNEFQLAIADPPYGIGDFRTRESQKTHSKIDWNSSIPTIEYFNEIDRTTKNRIIFGCNYYGGFIKDVGRIVHDKTGGGKRMGPGGLSDCDIASHSFGVNMKIFHFISIGNVCGNAIDWSGKERIHPCQKPVALYRWLLKNYANKGDHILDTHSGSCSNVIACLEMGYKITAIEIDEDYFNAGVERVRKYHRQGKLFAPPKQQPKPQGLF